MEEEVGESRFFDGGSYEDVFKLINEYFRSKVSCPLRPWERRKASAPDELIKHGKVLSYGFAISAGTKTDYNEFKPSIRQTFPSSSSYRLLRLGQAVEESDVIASHIPLPLTKFSEVQHLHPLVIQHIGVYTVCLISSLSSFTEPSESHTKEIIKLSSFLGSSPHQPIASARSGQQSDHQRLYKSTITTSIPIVEPQRGKSASSPAAISAGKDVVTVTDEQLHTLCSQFLTSLYQPQQSPEFWQKCATSLFASLVQLSVGEFASERRQQDFFQQMRSVLESATSERQQEQKPRGMESQETQQHRCLRSSSQSTISPHSGASSTSTISSLSHSCPRSDDPVAFSICALSASLDEIRQSTTTQLDEVFKRLSCLEQKKKAGDQ
ncbi:hypothetical protein TSMEX_010872 [Taenia solium]|eukprot:TsM_000122400 transcript=TsM_000122400 gene=TsM_000122400